MAEPSALQARDVESPDSPDDVKLREVVVVVASAASRAQTAALVLFGIVLLVACGSSAYLVHRLDEQEREERVRLERFERRVQQLDAGIQFEARRQHLLLGMRDEILRVNPRIGLQDAYGIAELAVEASERYPTVPPLLLLSVGIVESGFRVDATSAVGARGLYQIWPSTGRLLARSLGWEFTEEMLFDPVRNTEMAALYLDILFAAYNDPSLVLAEYNGGPRNAGLFRAGHADVAEETRNYVPKVLAAYERLQSQLDPGPTMLTDTSLYRDPRRLGKTLVPRADSRGGRAPLKSSTTAE